MTGRRRAAAGRFPAGAQTRPEGDTDAALDDALARIRDLTLRLWQIRDAHRTVRVLGRARCGTCGVRSPCPTLLAVGPLPVRRDGSGQLLAG